ncbi:MAG: hypothetical protein ABIF04_03765 [Chloroflexota bacterium]
MTVLTDWNITLSVDNVLRGQGADPETVRARRPALVAAAQQALDLGTSMLHPAALTRDILVRGQRHERIQLENGAQLTSPGVARHLSGAQRVVAAVCTIGSQLEEEVTRLLDKDSLHALALDGLGNAAVELLAQQVCERIGEQAQAEGLTASTPLSPGSPDWPVETGQPQIFALFDPSEAGIKLTSGGMMIPKKSITFVIGIGAAMAQTDLCAACNMQETCRYRHV